MRRIEWSNAIKKDYKKIKANPRHAKDLDDLLSSAVSLLAEDKPLPDRCRDHVLYHDWKGYRECHVKPDLLLIYKAKGPDVLLLARLSSHSELFG